MAFEASIERKNMSGKLNHVGVILLGLSLSCLFGLAVFMTVGPSLASGAHHPQVHACAKTRELGAERESRACTDHEPAQEAGFGWPM
jgi:hypothetical protein